MDRSIVWVPPGKFRRQPGPDSTLTFTGSGKLTFAGPITKVLDLGTRVRFGFLGDRLVMRIEIDPDVPALLVSKGNQVSDRSLIGWLPVSTVIKLEFDDDLCAFVEQSRTLRSFPV